jgi:hypothetical protein
MNIVQQVAASIGTAVFTVLLTNGLLDNLTPSTPPADVPDAMASVFSHTFWVATVMVAVVLVPAFFLPRRRLAAGSELPAPVLH